MARPVRRRSAGRLALGVVAALTVALAGEEEVNPHAAKYLNRLSDLLFVIARHENARVGVADVAWVNRNV